MAVVAILGSLPLQLLHAGLQLCDQLLERDDLLLLLGSEGFEFGEAVGWCHVFMLYLQRKSVCTDPRKPKNRASANCEMWDTLLSRKQAVTRGVGLGSDADGEYHDFGEPTDPRVHGGGAR